MTADPSDSIATRASLLGRLKNWEDDESWEQFTRTYWRLIYGVARQAGLSDDEARDVVQETLLAVAKKVHEFESAPGRGSFKNWMLNVTRWRIADHYRGKPPVQQPSFSPGADPDRTATAERVPDPADLNEFWEAEWKKSVLDTALARLRRRVKPKHAQIFDLYVSRGWPASEVAANLGVSVFQIYLVAHRLSRLLKEEVRYISSKLE
jgi:RNA polymerase sigma factor (sigma-70 family)